MELYKPEGSLYYEKDKIGDVLEVITNLTDNSYVVLVSREDDAYIVDYIHTYLSEEANRNDVVFLSREYYEWQEYEESQLAEQIETGVEVMRKNNTRASLAEVEEFWEDTNERE